MTFGEGLKSVQPSIFGGSACIFLNAAFVLYIVAFSSPFWFDFEDSYHLGLWSACYKVPHTGNSTTTTPSGNEGGKWECIEATKWVSNSAPGFNNDWLYGVEAILTISLIFHATTSAALIYYVGYPTIKKQISQMIVFLSFCLTFATAGFTLTAMIVCGSLISIEGSAVYRSDLSWSYFLAVTSTCVVWLCAAALMVEVVKVMAGSPVRPNNASLSTVVYQRNRLTELQQSIANNLERSTFQNEAVERDNEAAANEYETIGGESSTYETFT